MDEKRSLRRTNNRIHHENRKIKVVVIQSGIIVNVLFSKESLGAAYDWLRRQLRKKEEEEKKLKKLDKKMKKLTKYRKKGKNSAHRKRK